MNAEDGCTYLFDIEQGVREVDGLTGDTHWVEVTCGEKPVWRIEIQSMFDASRWVEYVCPRHAELLRADSLRPDPAIRVRSVERMDPVA